MRTLLAVLTCVFSSAAVAQMPDRVFPESFLWQLQAGGIDFAVPPSLSMYSCGNSVPSTVRRATPLRSTPCHPPKRLIRGYKSGRWPLRATPPAYGGRTHENPQKTLPDCWFFSHCRVH
jgi:hypothetical protein